MNCPTSKRRKSAKRLAVANMAPAPLPDLASWDIVLLNTSGGKDSQVVLDETTKLLQDHPRPDDFDAPRWHIAVHCDLGIAEWGGVPELAAKQVAEYGDFWDFRIIRRELGDLTTQIGQRRVALDAKATRLRTEAAESIDPDETAKLLADADTAYNAPAFPSSAARYCTSDQKTSQVKKLMTALVAEYRTAYNLTRRIRILNCLGIRGDESDNRATYVPFSADPASNGKREVARWYPIFHLTEEQVWERIKASGIPYHEAYDLGMPRLSCVFCVFASKDDLVLAAKHNPELAQRYVELEIETRSRIKNDLSMVDVVEEANRQLAEEKLAEEKLAEERAGCRVPVALRAA